MKKLYAPVITAIALSAPLAAMADSTTLYGNLRYSVNSVDDVGGSGLDGMTATDNVSLFGLKGSYGEEVKAIFHLQTGANADAGTAFSQRFYYGGLEGAFGQVRYGRMSNTYKMPGFKLDPFYNTAHIAADASFSAAGANYGLSPATNGFTDNSIEYTSPKLGDMVTVDVGIYLDDTNEDEHGTALGLDYNDGAINAGVRLASQGESVTIPGIFADGDATRIYGGYKGAGYSVAASYEMVDTSATEDTAYLYLTGTYALNDKTDLTASIGTVDDGTPADEGTGITVAIFNTITTNTKIFALYSQASLDATGAEDASTFSIGAFHDFSLTK